MVAPPSAGATPTGAKGKQSPAEGSKPTTRAKNGSSQSSSSAYHTLHNAGAPLSARRSQPLDLSTVERRGQSSTAARESPKRMRPHGLQEAPTFRPTEDEFRDPFRYIEKIAPEGRKYGIVKIIPPDSWNPSFAIDTERFHFRTRRQELNSVEGGTRANLNYLDQLAKYHKQNGNNLNRFPSVDKRPLDLYRLKKAVEIRGGFEKVCKLKKWAEIGRDLGYSGKIMSSLSTSLKNSYQRWLHPYEEWLRIAKPGVQQRIESENGGPYTPSPANSPLKKSQSNTPAHSVERSPAWHTSMAFESSSKDTSESEKDARVLEAPRPIHSSGFLAVNSPGFTPLSHRSTPFTPVNANNGARGKTDDGSSLSRRSLDGASSSPKNTPEYRPSTLSNITNGDSPKCHKRRYSGGDADYATLKGTSAPADCESEEGERRSKRLKKDVPTVAGSHMTLFRPSTPKIPREPSSSKSMECEGCGKADDPSSLLFCDSCDNVYHKSCLDPPLKSIPDHDWHCPRCLVGTGEYGFEEGGIYSLKQFQEKAYKFKENYFLPKMPFDPVLNCKKPVGEDDVEREFWSLVESLTDVVEVEYGADIHSTTHGSGFPTIEKQPLDPYSTNPWNLNILPLHPDSLFRHIKSDISGMTVPWLYVGMCFSTFCWHNEDHYTYSANYQHFGATKTWYGVPGVDADKFEMAMRDAVPDLFETQPDLLFQLVTLLRPEQLKKAGVNVYALDQRAGQFVITFPQAYHAGFNHGFNFNEAVNFAPPDWEPFGLAGVERLQEFRRQPCFSHDELLLTAVARDNTIKTAQWLTDAVSRLCRRETKQRMKFYLRHSPVAEHMCALTSETRNDHECKLEHERDVGEVREEEAHCFHCKCYVYLSRVYCQSTSRVLCLLHAGTYECCDFSEHERFMGRSHTFKYRYTLEELNQLEQKVRDRAAEPQAWAQKLDKALEGEAAPSLKTLRSLLSEGERIAYDDVPGLSALREYVERCNDWIERSMGYIVRKQQNRRKNEKLWRKGNSAKAAEMEERDRELRRIDNMLKLSAEGEALSFSSPELTQLQARAEAIKAFQKDAGAVLLKPRSRPTQEIEDLVEQGKSFNVDIPEVEELDKVVQQMKWNDQAREWRERFMTLQDVSDLIRQAVDLGIPEVNEHLIHFREQKKTGELWETKAKELMAAETVHYQQLEALSGQASTLPVSKETLAAVDQIMNKQREAHRQIVAFYDKSKHPDLRRRPKYKDVKEVMDTLADLNSKPTGTVDLEREQKRHEDWMRKGKKLFGKANAPLHILLVHMNHVEQRNQACFNIKDVPREPAEPSSREHSPANAESSSALDGPGRDRDVFCICRQSESGTMIECELCHEWYHTRCLKIARGKVKEDDKYSCPICDWRVKIPRDAARPKLEDLQDWQTEIPNLPFQPDEEDCLNRIIDTAQAFRDFIRPYTNSMMTTQQEVPTQRFYLRKIEGAEILLAWETNFFRQELHRLAPVAPEPPPVLEQSLSTRKPRPTKQQKLMAQLGIEKPEDLPQNLRTKQHSFSRRKSSEPHAKPAPTLQPAGGRSRSPQGLGPGPGPTGPAGVPGRRYVAPPGQGGEPSFSYEGSFNLATSPGHGSPAFADTGFMHHHHHHNDMASSPRFAPSSAHAPNLDPALFNGPAFGGAADNLNAAFDAAAESNQLNNAAAGNIDSMFASLTNQDVEALGGSSPAEEAVVVGGERANAEGGLKTED